MESVVLLPTTGNQINAVGNKQKGAGYSNFGGAVHTVSISVTNFIGRVYIEGSLETQPTDSDWFTINLVNNLPYVEFPRIPSRPTGFVQGDTSTLAYDFMGNYVWIRARLDRTYLNPPPLNATTVGSIDQILLNFGALGGGAGFNNSELGITGPRGPAGPTGQPGVTGSTGASGSMSSADDTTTNNTFYPLFTPVINGSISTVYTSSNKLTFNPSSGTLSSTDYASLSDLNFKENVQPIHNSLETLQQIQPVAFTWKDSHRPSLGVIAQEIEKILPQVVTTTGNVKSVSYIQLVALLVDAVKQQQIQIQDLQDKFKNLTL